MSWDLIGHGWAVDTLRRHIAMNAVRHAYLFTGPRGMGRATLAAQFAEALVCTQETVPDRPCGQCSACRRAQARNHPDVHWVEDEGGLKIDQVRELQRELALAPFEARTRVAIFPDFETSSEEAANALLKTLEEPGPHVVLIITSAMEEALLPTIVSRCEVMALRPMPVHDLAEALEARGTEREKAIHLAAQSMGRPDLALSMLEHPDLLERRTVLADDGLRMLSLSWTERFEYVQAVNRHKAPADNRRESAEVLEAWLGLWREILHRRYGVEGIPRTPAGELEVSRVAAQVQAGETETVLRAIETGLQRLEGNANPVLTMETVVLSMPRAALA